MNGKFDIELAQAKADVVAYEIAATAACWGVAVVLFVLGTAWLVIGAAPLWNKSLQPWDYVSLIPSVMCWCCAVWLIWTAPVVGESP
jgi:hypothetical protein